MSKTIKTSELFNVQTSYLKELFEKSEYSYDIIKNIENYIEKIVPTLDGFTKLKDGGANVGAGVIINPGTVLGKNTIVYSGVTLRGVYDENVIVKTSGEAIKGIIKE